MYMHAYMLACMHGCVCVCGVCTRACLVNILQSKLEYQVVDLTHQIDTVSPSGLMAEEHRPTITA